MIAVNVVRFRVRPGAGQEFVEAHRRIMEPFKGFLGGHLVKTGDDTYCWVGQWRSYQSLVDARPQMIGILDGFRHLLVDLGQGVTDPVSGESVVALPGEEPKRAKPKPKAKTKAAPKKKAAAKKKPVARKKAAKRARKRA